MKINNKKYLIIKFNKYNYKLNFKNCIN